MKDNIKMLITIVLFTASAVFFPLSASAATYYVAPTGNDANSGTLASPWKTIQKAASTMVVGDTVNIRAGTYNETITMQNSGNSNNRITYQSYNNENVIIPQDFTISKDYIVVNGLEIQGSMNIDGTYGRILGNYIHHGTAVFVHGSYNLISGNRISGHAWDQITTGWGNGAHHIVIEYNDVSDPEGLGEDFMQYMGHDIIVRGNYFHDNVGNGRHNDCYQSGGGEYNIWMIGNRFGNLDSVQYYMIGSGDHDHIWRNNVFWGSIGWGFNGSPTAMRVINNTFGTALGGYGYAGSGTSRNNIYNDWGTECPYGASSADYNLINPTTGSEWCVTRQPHDLWGVDPKFVNFTGRDFHLQSSSPCIDAGTFPTTITSAGSGTQIPVADAKIFVDGFGIADGDSIQLQGQTQVARITSINYTTNVLTVDQPLTWTSGLGVSIPYSGSAPDIGAYEYTSGAGTTPPAAPKNLKVTPK